METVVTFYNPLTREQMIIEVAAEDMLRVGDVVVKLLKLYKVNVKVTKSVAPEDLASLLVQ